MDRVQELVIIRMNIYNNNQEGGGEECCLISKQEEIMDVCLSELVFVRNLDITGHMYHYSKIC